MAVFTLEDAHGGVEVIVFPETYQRSAGLIETGTLVLVRGKLERDDETVRILATGDRAARQRPRAARARGGDPRAGCRPTAGMFEALGEIFSRHRGDRRVSFEIEAARRAGKPAARAGRRRRRRSASGRRRR